MKFYIATGFSRKKNHNILMKQLEKEGHEITFDWTKHEKNEELPISERVKIAQMEAAGVRDADFVAVLLPGKNGTHTELGIAIDQDKPTFIHGPGLDLTDEKCKTCIFYYYPSVKVFGGKEEDFPKFIIDNLSAATILDTIA